MCALERQNQRREFSSADQGVCNLRLSFIRDNDQTRRYNLRSQPSASEKSVAVIRPSVLVGPVSCAVIRGLYNKRMQLAEAVKEQPVR